MARDGDIAVLWRFVAAFGGGYLLVSGMVALMGSALPYAGLPRAEAISLGTLLALFVYVPVCLFVFASRSPLKDGMIVFVTALMLIGLATMV